jgi:PAS domain-containing protein
MTLARPGVQAQMWIASDGYCKLMRPIPDAGIHRLHLREHEGDSFLRIVLDGAHDGVWIRDPHGNVRPCRPERERKLKNVGSARIIAVHVRLKGIVQQDVPGLNMKAASIPRLFISASQYQRKVAA